MRNRLLVPGALVALVVTLGMLSFVGSSTPARAQPEPTPPGVTTPSTAAPTTSPSTTPTTSPTGAVPQTTSATVPVPATSAEGQTLFVNNCSSCHGPAGAGTDRGPNLVGVGAATVDFWVSTGRMPLAYPGAQAVRKPVLFSRSQQLAIVSYVTSQAPGVGPGIPAVNLAGANLANGNDMFGLNCAGCHTITGSGDALANSAFAPSLYQASPTQIAEAIRTGPGNMPRFGPGTLSDQDVNDIVRYVTYLQKPADPGGAGLGHVGPVTEGFLAIVVGLGVLILAAYWIGIRAGGPSEPPSEPREEREREGVGS
jgi:ubiquinol-cytochrome c reductase cytochrome c subunit